MRRLHWIVAMVLLKGAVWGHHLGMPIHVTMWLGTKGMREAIQYYGTGPEAWRCDGE